MLQRNLGSQGLKVSSIGLGCMGMSDFYGGSEQQNNMAVLSKSLELGVTFWDTADMYGPFTNERLLGEFFASNPHSRTKVQLATKFGIMRSEKGDILGINGRPEYVKSACESSLKNLGVDCIDLYYQHRVDTEVPIEETVGAMADLVKEGKVKYLGLSEASANTILRAHAVHPITAVQSEYSLWSRDVEEDVVPICQKMGIGFVPYSPLGRGFLTGAIRKRSDLQANDWRLSSPRFSEENFELNLQLVDRVASFAKEKGWTCAQLALSWLLSHSPNIVPIPGTRSIMRLAENAAACDMTLSLKELNYLTSDIEMATVKGDRYPSEYHSTLFGETPAQEKTVV